MRPQELKLLVIFDAIMIEGSVTRAAEQLSMTQPAVSNAVSKMRVLWKDELFVPDGRNIQPTTFANNLWIKVRDSLHNLNEAIEPSDFDPMTAKRTFRVALPDIVVDTIWSDMRLLFEQQAPGLNLYAVPYAIASTKQVLDDAEVDLVIGQGNRSLENICTDHLFNTSYVCAMRTQHPLAKSDLSIKAFANGEHLLVTLSGNTANPTDQALQQLGLTRRVAFTVNKFSSAVPMILKSDLIAILPTDLIHDYLAFPGLAVVPPPVSIPLSSISMMWHRRLNADEGLIWLRSQIKQLLVEQREQKVIEVCEHFGLDYQVIAQ